MTLTLSKRESHYTALHCHHHHKDTIIFQSTDEETTIINDRQQSMPIKSGEEGRLNVAEEVPFSGEGAAQEFE